MVGIVLGAGKEVEAIARLCVGVQDADEQRPYYGTSISGKDRFAWKTGKGVEYAAYFT
jgi:hypothetical protein